MFGFVIGFAFGALMSFAFIERREPRIKYTREIPECPRCKEFDFHEEL